MIYYLLFNYSIIQLFIIYYLLFINYYLLFIIYYLLFIIYYLLFIIYYLLFIQFSYKNNVSLIFINYEILIITN